MRVWGWGLGREVVLKAKVFKEKLEAEFQRGENPKKTFYRRWHIV